MFVCLFVCWLAVCLLLPLRFLLQCDRVTVNEVKDDIVVNAMAADAVNRF